MALVVFKVKALMPSPMSTNPTKRFHQVPRAPEVATILNLLGKPAFPSMSSIMEERQDTNVTNNATRFNVQRLAISESSPRPAIDNIFLKVYSYDQEQMSQAAVKGIYVEFGIWRSSQVMVSMLN